MSKKKKAEEPEIAVRPFDRYEVVELKRADITGADYNPRQLDDAAKKHLREILATHGMVNPPVVNRRSTEKGWPEGSPLTLVGGHQRLSQLDALHGSPNYTLMVALIDVTEIDEKKLNIALNNPNAQGDWDTVKLDALFKSGLDVLGTGFDQADIYQLFGTSPAADTEQLEQLAESLRKLRDGYRDNVRKARAKADTEFYIVVVFRDAEDCKGFLDRYGLDDNRYQDSRKLIAAIEKQATAEPVSA